MFLLLSSLPLCSLFHCTWCSILRRNLNEFRIPYGYLKEECSRQRMGCTKGLRWELSKEAGWDWVKWVRMRVGAKPKASCGILKNTLIRLILFLSDFWKRIQNPKNVKKNSWNSLLLCNFISPNLSFINVRLTSEKQYAAFKKVFLGLQSIENLNA